MLTALLSHLSPRAAHWLLSLLRIRLADAHEWMPCPCGAGEES
jgi:hypothetical protein